MLLRSVSQKMKDSSVDGVNLSVLWWTWMGHSKKEEEEEEQQVKRRRKKIIPF